MKEIPLTKEQRDFAAEKHNLVYAFLNSKGLREDDYYDVVIFGFLKAVREYLSKPHLQKYSFTTIAWRIMSQSIYRYNRSLHSKKNSGYTISLNTFISENNSLSLGEIIPVYDSLMTDLEYHFLMHDLALRVSRQQMKIVRMRADGHSLREIAQSEGITMKNVKSELKEIEPTILAVCM